MALLDHQKDGSVYLLTMIDRENSNILTPEVFAEHLGIPKELETSTDDCALVLTSGDPKS